MREIICWTCGARFMVDGREIALHEETNAPLFCPLGHCVVLAETELDQVRRLLSETLAECERVTAELRKQRDAANGRANGYKAQYLRLKKSLGMEVEG